MHHSITVIVPVHNQLEDLKGCCKIILANFYNDYPDSQLIVVDMNSTDGTEEWLYKQESISYIAIKDEVCKSQAYNTALEYAEGEMVLFLNCDAYITDHTISRLEEYLYLDENIAATGPVSTFFLINNLQNYMGDMPEFNNIIQAREFSDQLYSNNSLRQQYKTNFLFGFCLLAKKEAILSIGGFDNRYYANVMEDIDVSLKLINAGYYLTVAPAVFVYNAGTWYFEDKGYDYNTAYYIMAELFKKKWNFNFFYNANLRDDLLKYIDYEKANLSIMETGCAMGVNFTYIKAVNPTAELYGVELCEEVAFFAKKYANVRNEDLEKMDVPEWKNKFNYIIMGDIIEHLVDPWSVLKKLKVMLKEDGSIIASIPNIMNVSTMYHILSGKFTYADSGILDKTHMRFFTKYEIERMFNDCGYHIEFMGWNPVIKNEEVNSFEKEILSMKSLRISPDDFNTMQYIIRATKK